MYNLLLTGHQRPEDFLGVWVLDWWTVVFSVPPLYTSPSGHPYVGFLRQLREWVQGSEVKPPLPASEDDVWPAGSLTSQSTITDAPSGLPPDLPTGSAVQSLLARVRLGDLWHPVKTSYLLGNYCHSKCWRIYGGRNESKKSPERYI